MVAGDEEDGGEEQRETWDDLKDAPFAVDVENADPVNVDDEVAQDDEGEAFICPRALPEHQPPSLALVKKHNLTHWPYAPWCPHCVMARRLSDPHFSSRDGGEREIPLFVVDYAFIRNDADEEFGE